MDKLNVSYVLMGDSRSIPTGRLGPQVAMQLEELAAGGSGLVYDKDAFYSNKVDEIFASARAKGLTAKLDKIGQEIEYTESYAYGHSDVKAVSSIVSFLAFLAFPPAGLVLGLLTWLGVKAAGVDEEGVAKTRSAELKRLYGEYRSELSSVLTKLKAVKAQSTVQAIALPSPQPTGVRVSPK